MCSHNGLNISLSQRKLFLTIKQKEIMSAKEFLGTGINLLSPDIFSLTETFCTTLAHNVQFMPISNIKMGLNTVAGSVKP